MNRFAPALAAVACAAIVVSGCYSNDYSSSSTSSSAGAASGTTAAAKVDSMAPSAAKAKVHKLASGLQYEDLVIGDGKMAEPGLTAVVHYTGWLTDGTKFDSSYDRGAPLTFEIGAGRMIGGFDEGVRGMRAGGKRKLTIPPDLGYGAQGSGPVPPNATMVFEVTLLGVK
jgi:FKBP-type peptidyl-prolyl cis-trans isomerase